MAADLEQCRCIACGEYGHTDCSPRDEPRPRRLSCLNCGRGGHDALSCGAKGNDRWQEKFASALGGGGNGAKGKGKGGGRGSGRGAAVGKGLASLMSRGRGGGGGGGALSGRRGPPPQGASGSGKGRGGSGGGGGMRDGGRVFSIVLNGKAPKPKKTIEKKSAGGQHRAPHQKRFR
jgi:hypothetical protein